VACLPKRIYFTDLFIYGDDSERTVIAALPLMIHHSIIPYLSGIRLEAFAEHLLVQTF